ncbi:MAG: tRNA-2-methylthio-N6-dimethylallyladenosine synthase [Dokdonia sp.]
MDHVRRIIPNVAISQDMITGFPTETEEDHQDTLDLMKYAKYDYGFMFYYSERPGTMAERKMEDDIPLAVKKRRLAEVIEVQHELSHYNTTRFVGKTVEILVERTSKKSDQEWSGRTEQNTVAVFPKENYKMGEFVMVKITECTTSTLRGIPVGYSDNN